MDPQSVYNDTWSATTWMLMLSAMVVFVLALMLTMIAMVHRAAERMKAPADLVRDPLAGVAADAAAINADPAPHSPGISAA